MDHMLAELRRTMRRRVALLVLGLATFILAAELDAEALGWPGWVAGVCMGLGVLVALTGLFGLRRGLGCAGQLLVLLWLGDLACGLTLWASESGSALARTLLAAGAVALLLHIWRRRPAGGDTRGPWGPAGPPPPWGPENTPPDTAPHDVIDVDAHEVPPDDDG